MPALRADAQAIARAANPHKICVRSGADASQVADLVQDFTGRFIDVPALHYRLFTEDRRAVGVVVLHNIGPTAEAELVAWATPGIWQRSTLRFLATWIFHTCGIRRLVVRIPASDDRLKDFARRAGFRHEGTLRGYFPTADASLWAMLPHECPWLR